MLCELLAVDINFQDTCACAHMLQWPSASRVMPVRLAVGRGVPEALRLHLLRGRAWVSGRWVKAASGKTFPVLNPANGKLIAEVRKNI